MQRQGQLEIAKGILESAADVLGVSLLDALFVQPPGNFGVADGGRAGALGDRHRVADVVAVPVGDEDVIRRDLLRLDRGSRVAAEERVDQQLETAGLKPEGGVSVPGECVAHDVLRN